VSSRNQQLFERAQAHIPGGVNSPVRAFRSVGGTPRFVVAGAGARVTDADGASYIDYVGSWGPLILGHAHPEVVAAVREAALAGLSFGAPTESEIDMAELLCTLLPALEMVRLVSSGTEATMSAIRLARGHTGRDLLLKFEGCYHGHSDSLLVKAGSGLLTLGNPSSAGVPADLAQHTLVLDYNDSEQVVAAFKAHGDHIAAVIVEPVAGNMNLIAPRPPFLQTLRDECSRYGAVLIFDEVMTGFRVGPQGAQGLYGITPDLTTLGKVIGGGMPVGAFGGRRDIMSRIAPLALARCIRRARSPATRWPWPRAWRRCGCCRRKASTSSWRPARAASAMVWSLRRGGTACPFRHSRSAACSVSISVPLARKATPR